ncbi:DUF2267 domain-containing protein [Solwaraspora sp. WMMD406]|uniref:DUF2267 domain-containing protein n=1 Tax=Solwaraspora sp. WMMD406 TaxID=3016095 RepID=UPI0024169EF7|nr:DUF2267 domain-containing protein [Solwaraspora sp. WMMD406]MDG4766278.1 DUF2267 domain-containing protein [Solwaraspora sp. WMMD406]
MATAQLSTVDATVDKTNRMLGEIDQLLGWPAQRRHQSYAALTAVLHALRDRLPVTEAVQLGAQLPLLVRGLYYEGWEPASVPVKLDRDAFVARVRRDVRFDVDGGAVRVIEAVTQVLRRHVSAGEWDDVHSNLPADLRGLLAG